MNIFDPKKHDIIDLQPKDFQTVYDSERTYPFFEDENGGYVYAYGHVDEESLAFQVATYFRETGDSDYGVCPDDVTHAYALGFADKGSDEWRFELVPETQAGRFPISVVGI